MSQPLIALLTDFGTRDHYVGAMKGAILSICPDAKLIDISHEIPRHDMVTASLELSATYRYFPPESIFLVVVDPGVGSARRGLAARAGNYFFVAPDNGVLTSVFQELEPNLMVDLTERFYANDTVSRTFEGRDRFGPGAAWIAKGIELSKLGSPFKNYHRLKLEVPEVCGESIRGSIVRVDHFGNLVTNISLRVFKEMSGNGAVKVEVGDFVIPRVVETYADIAADEVCGLFGSTGHLELAGNASSAAKLLGVSSGLSVVVSRTGVL
tara:strand:+ start:8193 stop:8993 length:801 start_codon:yes stop_codon:yes gene_type:complete